MGMTVGQADVARTDVARRGRRSNLKAREARAFWLFLSPWVIGFLLFTGGPIIASAVLSFTDYQVTSPPNFLGFDNYGTLFQDNLFVQSLKVTALYAVLAVIIGLVVALAVAMLLNQRIVLRGLFRTIIYLPTVVSGVVVALLWEWILNPSFGIINYILSILHLPQPLWFQSETAVIPAFVAMSVWALGGQMIIFLAALQGVPQELYDAVAVDGGNAWARFWKITLPLLSPTVLFNLITGLIASFQVFTPAQIITQGGPNFASEFYVLYLFQNAFQNFKMGYASAQAWILFLIIFALTGLTFWISSRFVYYET
jgi:multiple sugar transport system permease protein